MSHCTLQWDANTSHAPRMFTLYNYSIKSIHSCDPPPTRRCDLEISSQDVELPSYFTQSFQESWGCFTVTMHFTRSMKYGVWVMNILNSTTKKWNSPLCLHTAPEAQFQMGWRSTTMTTIYSCMYPSRDSLRSIGALWPPDNRLILALQGMLWRQASSEES